MGDPLEIEMDGVTAKHISDRILLHLADQPPEKMIIFLEVELLGSEYPYRRKILIKYRKP